MIERVAGGWKVKSESGKNLSGVLKTLSAAKHRLRVIEYWKARAPEKEQ